MGKNRLEAFSDGVLAIIITIMVLELEIPTGDSLAALAPLTPVLMSYALSFVYVGIYWNNHHHMLHTCNRVTGGILWANLHLLFWLSLLPFVTGWMGANHFAPVPSALYGVVLLAAAIAYWMLQQTIIASQGPQSPLKAAVGRDWKGRVSPALYLLAIVCTLAWTWVAQVLYVAVALLWLVPDPRIERSLDGAGVPRKVADVDEGAPV
ncbi:MAG: DUF1211 domain-containing protein [Gemmatimonadaceae bacterium]|nr:DUF1211 domain-containing protein [Gemmatimonadaceae bacterium]